MDTEDTCPVTERAPMAHLARLVSQTKPPVPLTREIEELSPDDFEHDEE